LVGWLAALTASAFNHLGQCANSPGNRAYCKYCYHGIRCLFPRGVDVTVN